MVVPDFLIAAALGAAAGLHTATWGIYKDSIHEGFFWPRYFRSPIVGAIMALIAYVIAQPDLSTAAGKVAFFGVAYVLERGAIELWKTFLRNEDQSKYFIPMQFAIFGKVVHSQARRLVIGAIITTAVCGTFLLIHYSASKLPLIDSPIAVFLVASVSGWISAFLGAWKDAPVEGFQPLKFVRSPLWAGFWGLLIAHFTMSILVVMMAGLGYTIFTLETYKTFFFPSKPRGKFAGKPILFPDMLRRRQHFVPLYAAIWAGVLIGFYVALSGPHQGLIHVL
jgi:mannitol-specific phosphotransferase system IIBC component